MLLGGLQAAIRFMFRWHIDEAHLRQQRMTSAVGSGQGNGGKAGGATKAGKENPPKAMRDEGATTTREEVEGKTRWTN